MKNKEKTKIKTGTPEVYFLESNWELPETSWDLPEIDWSSQFPETWEESLERLRTLQGIDWESPFPDTWEETLQRLSGDWGDLPPWE